MAFKILFILFLSIQPVTDLDRFITNYKPHIVYERSRDLLANHVRFNPDSACPEVILFIYEKSGKLFSTSVYSKAEFSALLSHNKIGEMNGRTACVMVKNTVYLLKSIAFPHRNLTKKAR